MTGKSRKSGGNLSRIVYKVNSAICTSTFQHCFTKNLFFSQTWILSIFFLFIYFLNFIHYVNTLRQTFSYYHTWRSTKGKVYNSNIEKKKRSKSMLVIYASNQALS